MTGKRSASLLEEHALQVAHALGELDAVVAVFDVQGVVLAGDVQVGLVRRVGAAGIAVEDQVSFLLLRFQVGQKEEATEIGLTLGDYAVDLAGHLAEGAGGRDHLGYPQLPGQVAHLVGVELHVHLYGLVGPGDVIGVPQFEAFEKVPSFRPLVPLLWQGLAAFPFVHSKVVFGIVHVGFLPFVESIRKFRPLARARARSQAGIFVWILIHAG